MAEPGAELARDVVSCPGADTCNLAVTQSRGLAAAIGDALEDAGLAEVPGVRVNISGCTNSCGQHHISDIGFFGLERRAHGRAAPGYQMLLGGHLGDTRGGVRREGHEGAGEDARPKRSCGSSGASTRSASRARCSRRGSPRSGGAKGVGDTLTDLDHFPTPDVGPEFYVDYDETGPYVADVGDGECAATMSLAATADRRSDRPAARRRRPRASSPRSRPSSSTSPRRARSSGRGSASAPTSCSRRRSRTASSSTSRRKAAPGIEVVFLDTQYHFAETLWYVERVRERYDLNLTVMQPLVAPDDLWQTDPDECCAMRKVEPLARALARQAGVDDRFAPRRVADAHERADRRISTSAAAS